MQMNKLSSEKTRKLTITAMLTAIVVVLQVVANFVQPIPGVSITLVLVPVILGAAIVGPLAGMWLGLVFGATVLLLGGATMFLTVNPAGTIITVLVKGMLAGLCAGLVFNLLKKINEYLAVFVAGIVCPVVNTGIFVLGCRLFFWDAIVNGNMTAKFSSFRDAGFASPFAYVVLGFAGINFLIELGVDMILSPVIVRLLNIWRNKHQNG